MLCKPGFNPFLNGHSCLTMLVISQAVQETQKTRILGVLTLEPQDQSNHLKSSTFVLLVVNSRQQMIHTIVSFFHLY